MQETPNFNTYKAQINDITLAQMLDAREKVQDPFRAKIESAYNLAKAYFDDDEFRATLNLVTKQALEAQIANMIAQFNQLKSWQADGSTQISVNIQGIVNNLDSYVNEYDSRYSLSRQIYDLQGGRNISRIVDGALEKEKTATQTVDELTKKLTEADKLIGYAASNELADYYQQLVDGRTVSEVVSDGGKKRPEKKLPWGGWLYAIAVLFIYLVIDKAWSILNRHHLSKRFWITTGIAVFIPLVIYLYVSFSNRFNKSCKTGFTRTGYLWMLGALAATLFTALYAAFLVAELGPSAGWQDIVPKLIGLLAPAYFIRFCVQNYRANMHLAIQNSHKATVARTVKQFSELVNHNDPNFTSQVLTGRIDIIKSAAHVVFTPSETGFLTTKEGAGGNDNLLDGVVNINK